MSITIQNVSKTFGAFQALSGVNLEVPSGGLTALLGPSGSGKTTLLRIVAGLESADEETGGQILFDGVPVTDNPVCDRQSGQPTSRGLRLSALRVVPAHDRV